MDELFGDFSKKMSGLFGANGGKGGGKGSGGQSFGSIGGIVMVLSLFWVGTGFFIVEEGQQAVITRFGQYKNTVGAGFNWHLPSPIERHETVFVTQMRSIDIGRDAVIAATGLKESAMLTQDENIVEIKFAVQYRLKDARAYLFASADPDASVQRAAETALREVVGNMKLDAVLADERDQIAPRMRTLMQTILDRYNVGIEVVSINLQQGGVRPPEQVQAAFDDVLKAGQERERAKNEAQAYANDVIPRARGSAARLIEEANGYKERVVAQAQGDAERFSLIQSEYAKSPQVTRQRLYLEAMQDVYSSVTKVMVDSSKNSNLLYLPMDRLVQQSGGSAGVDALTNELQKAPISASDLSKMFPRLRSDESAERGRQNR